MSYVIRKTRRFVYRSIAFVMLMSIVAMSVFALILNAIFT